MHVPRRVQDQDARRRLVLGLTTATGNEAMIAPIDVAGADRAAARAAVGDVADALLDRFRGLKPPAAPFICHIGMPISAATEELPMPLDRLVLIVVIVIAAAGATVWLASLLAAAIRFPLGWAAVLPAALVAYVVWRVIADRIGNAEDDHYDRIEK